jgi:serine/threonine protein phosphatase PrpC
VRFECYGASLARDDGGSNEDAFWIGRTMAAAAICDGAGRAAGCAQRTARLFGQQMHTGSLDVARFPGWKRWLTSLDASLSGGPQTTFVGIAVVDDRLVGACAGDSRALLVNERGCRSLTSRSPRLGSGLADPTPIHEVLAAHDVVLLMSDGAWGPLTRTAMTSVVATWTTRHLADLPSALLDRAASGGRTDDMTVVAMRIRR